MTPRRLRFEGTNPNILCKKGSVRRKTDSGEVYFPIRKLIPQNRDPIPQDMIERPWDEEEFCYGLGTSGDSLVLNGRGKPYRFSISSKRVMKPAHLPPGISENIVPSYLMTNYGPRYFKGKFIIFTIPNNDLYVLENYSYTKVEVPWSNLDAEEKSSLDFGINSESQFVANTSSHIWISDDLKTWLETNDRNRIVTGGFDDPRLRFWDLEYPHFFYDLVKEREGP